MNDINNFKNKEKVMSESFNKDQVIARIKKLLALASSSNKAEAELAAKRANELLLKYNLSMKEVDREKTEVIRKAIKSGSRSKKWRLVLLNTVAEVNFCEFIYVDTGIGFRFDIIGKSHNAEIVASIYEYLEKAIMNIAQKECHKNAKYKYREHFRYGMATEISVRLFEIMKQNQQSGPSDQNALVVAVYENEKKDIDCFLQSQGLTFSETKLDEEALKKKAFQKGILAGRKVGLNNQLNNSQSRNSYLD